MQESQHTDFKQKYLDSEEKFQKIFKQTSSASKIISSDLTILKVNQALIDLLGFSAEEIEGTKILDYACPEYIKHWHHLQDGLWANHMPFFNLEACLIAKNKSLVWVNVTTVLYHENNETFGFTILDDITYRNHFKESEKRLNLALQYSKMAVWEMNLNDYSVVRSDSHDEIFGYKKTLDHWSKETYLSHLIADEVPHFEQEIGSLLKDSVFDFISKIYTIDGVEKWVQFQGKVDQEINGKPEKILGTIKDITREKVAERHKDEFINIVSHELRTPITSIKAQAQLLERKFVSLTDENTRIMLKRINLQINKLSLLIKDLLETSRSEEQIQPLRKSDFMFDEMIQETVRDLQRTSSTHQIVILKNPILKYFGDKERVAQVLANLIKNAIKFSPGKSKVIVSVNEETDLVSCSVKDFGIGIAMEEQHHVFDRFYKISDERSYDTSGFGLGLYISSEIIKQMNGKLWLKTEPDQGTIFYFSIPK